MINKVLVSLFLLLLSQFYFASNVVAKGEFASSYDITYNVDEDGVTEVTEKVTLKNLTDRYYPSNFNLTIAATEISDILASDNQGFLELNSSPVNGKTEINVKFSQQITGKGKEYTWTLKFKSKDFAQNFGKIWDISIPKLASGEDIENYRVNLLTPVSFGDPSVMVPIPNRQIENAGKLQYTFTKEQLLQSGISAIFGDEQTYDFKLTFNLVNNGLLPKVFQLGLPSNTPYQKSLINSIEPKPDNVTLDSEGNYLALFRVDRAKSYVVEARGQVQTYINPLFKDKNLNLKNTQKYLTQDKYWEKDNPLIKEKLIEILNLQKPSTNFEKANLINKYVSSVLQFNLAPDVGYKRLGAVTALNNPTKAKCYEYSDLFIAFARAANIPTRENIGLGYRGNSNKRPECFPNSELDIWPEYYDQDLGWVMVDPTWESTTGGSNYFNKFDLNHISLAKRFKSEGEIALPVTSELSFSSEEFKPTQNIRLLIDTPATLFASLPVEAKIRIENLGSSVYRLQNMSFTSARTGISPTLNLEPIDIPPLGNFEKSVSLKTGYAWDSYEDILQLKVGSDLSPASSKVTEKQILVKPLFAYKRLTLIVVLIFILIIAAYLTTLIFHLKSYGKTLPKIKKPKFKKKK